MEFCNWGGHVGGCKLYSATQVTWCKLQMIFVLLSLRWHSVLCSSFPDRTIPQTWLLIWYCLLLPLSLFSFTCPNTRDKFLFFTLSLGWNKLLVYLLDLWLGDQRMQRRWPDFRKRSMSIRISCSLTLRKNIWSSHTRCKSCYFLCAAWLMIMNHQRLCSNGLSVRLAYFKAAFELFEAEYYVKADDDIYLRPGTSKCVDFFE